jgi:hypothetical protein
MHIHHKHNEQQEIINVVSVGEAVRNGCKENREDGSVDVELNSFSLAESGVTLAPVNGVSDVVGKDGEKLWCTLWLCSV